MAASRKRPCLHSEPSFAPSTPPSVRTGNRRSFAADRRSRLRPILQETHVNSSSSTPDHSSTARPEAAPPPATAPTDRPGLETDLPPARQTNFTRTLNAGLPECCCPYCGARFWYEERINRHQRASAPLFPLCCKKGHVKLPLLGTTPAYLEQFLGVNGGPFASHFQKNIRSYNAAFSFTSFGAELDPRVARTRGPYSFVICGENYHRIGSLLPVEGRPPRYSQLYVFDPESELSNRLANFSSADHSLKPEIVDGLMKLFDVTNELVRSFRAVRTSLLNPASNNLRLRIVGLRDDPTRQYALPTGSELAGLIPGDFVPDKEDRDIIIDHRTEGLKRITSLNPKFDALHFQILFPYGEDGFHENIRYDPAHTPQSMRRKCVTQREYYAYRIQHRDAEGQTLIRGGRALQHYIVDAFSTIEQNRLAYLRNHQSDLRTELYAGLTDAFQNGDTTGADCGHVLLPASYTGSPRYMKRLYLDAMAVVQKLGNTDLFITFTCNSQWPEITNAFRSICGCRSEFKPHIVARVFRMKQNALKDELNRSHFFGKAVAGLRTVEFQKRGLPHVHILLWLDKKDKLLSTSAIDSTIAAELPDPIKDPVGYEAVTKFMLHGPCGPSSPASPCMKDGHCKKFFPKAYNSETSTDQFGYTIYRRRDTGITFTKNSTVLDNRFVVPYNRNLVVLFQAHINVELCHQGRLVKYLFKYITKGPDRSMVIADNVSSQPSSSTIPHQRPPLDEIKQYLDCRTLSSYEATWRLFEFPLHEREPSVQILSVHLEHLHSVPYRKKQRLTSILGNPVVTHTTLTRWFTLNQRDSEAHALLYSEIPNKYTWHAGEKDWFPRKQGFSIGRVVYIHPSSGDTFYLRQLLTKVRGATSFVSLRTVDGFVCRTFQAACERLGLLSGDDEWLTVLLEVGQWGMSCLLRYLFVSMLMFCELADPRGLFDKVWELLAEDIVYFSRRESHLSGDTITTNLTRDRLLWELSSLLTTHSTSLSHFGLPSPSTPYESHFALNMPQPLQVGSGTIFQQERLPSLDELNDDQRFIFLRVLHAINSGPSQFFFISGHGGTGKTFLYKALIAHLRDRAASVVVVASSGIAATLLPNASTAHSRFKIPLEIDHHASCNIKKGSALAQVLIDAALIIWDEAPMIHRLSFEAVDRAFCDILNVPFSGPLYKPFGGKNILLGGDFRQTLPVIPNAGREESIDASLTRSNLWLHCKPHYLMRNMRVSPQSPEEVALYDGLSFTDWALAVGNGTLPNIAFRADQPPDWISIPSCFLIDATSRPIPTMCSEVYSDFATWFHDPAYLTARAIVTPTNQNVKDINTHMLDLVLGAPKTYYSSDGIHVECTSARQLEAEYPTEFLNSLSFNGYPDHEIRLKVFTPIMLLRNLNPSIGLCNGTRIMVTYLGAFVIKGVIMGGSFNGSTVAIPRVVLNINDSRWPFILKRRQFPVRLSYAMTINKSQGQTLQHVGLYLPKPVFSHGQLYVAISRVRSAAGLRILITNETGIPNNYTRNIVYQEALQDLT